MPRLPEAIKRVTSYLSGGEKKDSTPDQLHRTTTDADSTENQTPSVLSAEGESNTTTAGSKRGRDEDKSRDVGRGRQKLQPSADERRLTGDYRTAGDSIPISVPTYDSQDDWKPRPSPSTTQKSMTISGRSRGVQPVNTLGTSKLAARSTQGDRRERPVVYDFPGNPYSTSSAQFRAEQLRIVETVPSRGGNVGTQDDEDDYRHTQARKRQKTDHIKSVYDLTGNDKDEDVENDIIGRTKGRMKDQMPDGAKVSLQKMSNKRSKNADDSPFATSTLQTMNSATSVPLTKKLKNTAVSQNLASDYTPDRPRMGSKQQPVAIDGDEDSPNSSKHPSLPSNGIEHQKPPICLEEGLDDAADAYVQKHTQTNLSQGSHQDPIVVSAGSQARPNEGRAVHTQSTEAGRQRTLAPHLIPGQGFRTGNSFQPSVMRKNFVRDHPPQGKAGHQRARDRMQTNHGRSSFVDDESGDDPITGARTIASRGSLSQILRDNTASKNAQNRCEPDGSNHRRAQVKQTSGAVRTADSRPPLPARPGSIDNNDEGDYHIAIASILCRAYVGRNQHHELVWSSERQAFYVICGQERVTMPHSDTPVTIGKREVKEWKYSKGELFAQLKGPKSEVSIGGILLHFRDQEGMNLCQDLLLDGNPKSSASHIEDNGIIKIFEHQSIELEKAHESFKQAAKQNTEQSARARQRQEQSARPRHSYGQGDDIIYESAQVLDQYPKALSKMQMGNTFNGGIRDTDEGTSQSGQVPSKYFSNRAQYEARRSGRQPVQKRIRERTPSPPPPPEKWTAVNNPPVWQHPLTYPAQGPRRVTVDFNDIPLLDEGELLNDNVVNFELRYIEEQMEPEHRRKVHFFNTYFFSALSTKNNSKTFNYEAVERWTKNIDLFNVPYVVVPINVSFHWFVVVICNLPSVKRKFSGFDDEDERGNADDAKAQDGDGLKEPSRSTPADNENDLDSAKVNSEVLALEFQFQDGTGFIDGSPNNTADKEAPSSRPSTARDQKSKKKAPPGRKYDVDKPIIITLDSLGGVVRSAELRYLKQYVGAEAATKRKIEFDWHDLKAMTAKGIPEQPNFSDCGVYLCGYMAEFAKDPEKFVHMILQKEMDQNREFADFDPSAKRAEIRDRLLQLQKKQEETRKAEKRAKVAMKKGKPSTKAAVAATPDATAEQPVPQSSATLPAAMPSPPAQERSIPIKGAPTIVGRAIPSHSPAREAAAESTPNSNEHDDDLEVAPPLTLASARNRSSSPRFPDNQADELNEMLDDVDNPDERELSTEANTPPRGQATSELNNQTSRFNSSQGNRPLLDDLQTALNAPKRTGAQERTSPSKSDQRERITLDIGYDDAEGMRAEIPESQEKVPPNEDASEGF